MQTASMQTPRKRSCCHSSNGNNLTIPPKQERISVYSLGRIPRTSANTISRLGFPNSEIRSKQNQNVSLVVGNTTLPWIGGRWPTVLGDHLGQLPLCHRRRRHALPVNHVRVHLRQNDRTNQPFQDKKKPAPDTRGRHQQVAATARQNSNTNLSRAAARPFQVWWLISPAAPSSESRPLHPAEWRQ